MHRKLVEVVDERYWDTVVVGADVEGSLVEVKKRLQGFGTDSCQKEVLAKQP